MNGNNILLRIELDAIRDFLEHVDIDAGAEIRDVFARNDQGEYEDIDDFENALFNPLMRQEIAARAVYYELNALIERELQYSAHPPWLESNKHRGPKSLDWNNLTLDSIRSLKIVQDLSYKEIVKLVEEAYHIKIENLAGGEAFRKMREMVNAFKHRGGLIDFRKQEPKDMNLVQRYEADIEQAYEAIENAYIFVKVLWEATGRTPSVSLDEVSALDAARSNRDAD